MPSSESDSDDNEAPPPANAPFLAYEYAPPADEYAPAPMDVEGSSSHDVS